MILMLVLRILVCCVIYSVMKDFSNTFLCGFWCSFVIDIFMATTRAKKVEG